MTAVFPRINAAQQATIDRETSERCVVVDRSGFITATPKGLGWLLRHSDEVNGLIVTSHPTAECVLVADLSGQDPGMICYCPFASSYIAWNWLRRPKFAGVGLDWFGYRTVVGRDDHRQASEAMTMRKPTCVQCGKVSGRWYQPLVSTQNFCSIRCVQKWAAVHYTDGTHRAGADCQAFAHAVPTVEPSPEWIAAHRGCDHIFPGAAEWSCLHGDVNYVPAPVEPTRCEQCRCQLDGNGRCQCDCDGSQLRGAQLAIEFKRRHSTSPRGCAHALRSGLSFATPHDEAAFCPEPAIDGSDYCQAHDHLYPA